MRGYFDPQRRRVRREEKNSGAKLALAEEFFIPLKFYGRAAQRHSKICIP